MNKFIRKKHHFGNNKFVKASKRQTSIDISLLVKKAVDEENVSEFIPSLSFKTLNINERLKYNIEKRGYIKPTPIQDQVIPLTLQGKDVVGIANTGTGKTAAFLIPLINKIVFNRNEKVLILAPTRELAVQIQKESQELTQALNIYSQLCIGGVSINQQIMGLRRNPNIVIGTPGRIKDLKNQGKLRLESYKSVVLDEVDRMLDMGFIHDMKYIISNLPQIRQSLFFSATVSRPIEEVMHSFSNNPIKISIKSNETSQSVDQDIIKMNGRNKLDILTELLNKNGFNKVIIFGRTKWGIEKLNRQLNVRGFRVSALHGNKSQNQRQRALEEFRQNRISILLATDIASRGLDISNVTHVINYDIPQTYEDYIHRIGRTGRADKKGIALTFVD